MFDHFAKEKSDFLKKKDKSKKGCIDKDIIKIVNLINSKRDCYTTSSCAGRIVLLEMKSKRKNECNWIFTKHSKVKFNEIYDSLNNYSNKNNSKIPELPLNVSAKEETCFDGAPESLQLIGETPRYGRKGASSTRIAEQIDFKNLDKTKNKINQIWFKQQPLILHVACRNIDSAKKLLYVARKIFRRAGIIGITKRKVMVEIIGDERLETIIGDKNFVADESYLKELVKYANENFWENKKKRQKFLNLIKEL